MFFELGIGFENSVLSFDTCEEDGVSRLGTGVNGSVSVFDSDVYDVSRVDAAVSNRVTVEETLVSRIVTGVKCTGELIATFEDTVSVLDTGISEPNIGDEDNSRFDSRVEVCVSKLDFDVSIDSAGPFTCVVRVFGLVTGVEDCAL